MKFKKGDKVTSKKNPELNGEIIDIQFIPFIKDKIFIDKPLYILDWGGKYFEEELEFDK